MNENPNPNAEALQRAPVYPLSGIIGALRQDAARRYDANLNQRQLGPITRMPLLDKLMGGCLEPGLHILHGSPGSGKSALALGIAADCGAPALFVSAELGALEVLRRLIARTTGKYLGRLKDGSLTPNTIQELAEKTAEQLPFLGIMDATIGTAPVEHIASAIASLREAPGAEGAPGALVVVDSAHTWASRLWPDEEEYQRLSRALDELELLAKTLSIPLLLIAERNRASMKAGGQSGAAGNRRFEYAGESVIELDAVKEGEGEDEQGYREVKLTVSKNRHGSCGQIRLKWHGAMQRHSEKGEQ